MDRTQKILVIQLKRAGDVVVTTPVLPALRERFPKARIDFLVERPFATLLERHPDVDRVQVYDRRAVWKSIWKIRKERYDWIFDFQSSPRSALLVLLSGARQTAGYRVPFWGGAYGRTVKRPGGPQSVVDGKFSLLERLTGPLAARPSRQIVLSPEEKQWAAQAMDSGADRTIVGLVPTHRRLTRRWPAESFAAVGRALLRQGMEVWLFWGPGEEAYVDRVEQGAPGSRKIPSTSLREMAALLERCRLVITNDNGPMHLAVAVGVPTVTIYGPTDPASWNPGGAANQVLQAEDVSCLGCNLNECPFDHECMTRVSPERVLRVAEAMLTQAALR